VSHSSHSTPTLASRSRSATWPEDDNPYNSIPGIEAKVESVQPAAQTVEIRCSLTFKDLETFAAHGAQLWSQMGFSHLVLSADAQKNLRFALTTEVSSEQLPLIAKRLRAQFTANGAGLAR
jgi:hypothetical protein